MDHRDSKPGPRITKKDIDDTLAYAKEKLVDAYDVNNNGLSAAEIANMSFTARLAVRYAILQDQIEEVITTDKLYDSLFELGNDLYFPAWANESDAYLSVFRKDADLKELTRKTLVPPWAWIHPIKKKPFSFGTKAGLIRSGYLIYMNNTNNRQLWNRSKYSIFLWKNTSLTSRIS